MESANTNTSPPWRTEPRPVARQASLGITGNLNQRVAASSNILSAFRRPIHADEFVEGLKHALAPAIHFRSKEYECALCCRVFIESARPEGWWAVKCAVVFSSAESLNPACTQQRLDRISVRQYLTPAPCWMGGEGDHEH